MKRVLLKSLPLVLALSPFFASGIFGQETPAADDGPDPETQAKIDECMGCHSAEAEMGPVVNLENLRKSPHGSFDCQSCHSSITELPHTPAMTEKKPTCSTCHEDQVIAFLSSTHSNRDYVRGDHPSCVFCHGGGQPHAITAGSKWTRKEKIEVCTQCHSETERMKRYHVDPDAVSSYHESFHGKALERFGNEKTAICTDCHGHHDVLAPMDPKSPTHRNNAAATCAQAGCHPGAKVDFAMSGANHLRLKAKESPLLAGVLLFFQFLIFGTISFMLANVGLDLRKTVFRSNEPPQCGKPAAWSIALSFVALVFAIGMAALRVHGVRYFAFAAAGFLVLAYVLYLFRPKHLRPSKNGISYMRMSLGLRIQHLLLPLSVAALMATGLPLRFADSDFAQGIMALLGGLESARLVHRGAAVVMMFTWTWHLVWLIVRWGKAGWSFKSWTMLPTRKDLADFIQVSKNYLGLSNEEPKFGRYTFRSKVDYLAEYWGLPVMVASGFVLWFPMYFSDRLSESAWGVAFIAHGYEATLALLAIICWHLYNVHYSPNVFPLSTIWIRGKISREEMEREHPLELEEIDAEASHLATEPDESRPNKGPKLGFEN